MGCRQLGPSEVQPLKRAFSQSPRLRWAQHPAAPDAEVPRVESRSGLAAPSLRVSYEGQLTTSSVRVRPPRVSRGCCRLCAKRRRRRRGANCCSRGSAAPRTSCQLRRGQRRSPSPSPGPRNSSASSPDRRSSRRPSGRFPRRNSRRRSACRLRRPLPPPWSSHSRCCPRGNRWEHLCPRLGRSQPRSRRRQPRRLSSISSARTGRP